MFWYLIHNGGICLEVFNKSTVVNSFDSQAWKQLYFATRSFTCSGEILAGHEVCLGRHYYYFFGCLIAMPLHYSFSCIIIVTESLKLIFLFILFVRNLSDFVINLVRFLLSHPGFIMCSCIIPTHFFDLIPAV